MARAPAPDPRFDPRFQRGYDGPEPALPPPVRQPKKEPVGAVRPEVGNDAPRAGASDGGADRSTAAPAAPEVDEFWVPPRRNPFALVLLVGGLAMIAAGGWLFWSVVTASSYPDGYDRAQQAFALAQQQLTPALLICGVLGIVGWLVLGAIAASDRKGE